MTIFPEQINFYLNQSIPKQAQQKEKIFISVINIRKNQHEQVDDYAYGGSTGMVLMVEPIVSRLQENNLLDQHIVLLSPRGQLFTQKKAHELANLNKKIVFICGHYEGVDDRILNWITEEISIGDYVLSSGELSSLVVADSIIRLIPEVINPISLQYESFSDDLLDHPSYTRPENFKNILVPGILLSGNHAEIKKYRDNERIKITQKYRPDLYQKYLNKK